MPRLPKQTSIPDSATHLVYAVTVRAGMSNITKHVLMANNSRDARAAAESVIEHLKDQDIEELIRPYGGQLKVIEVKQLTWVNIVDCSLVNTGAAQTAAIKE